MSSSLRILLRLALLALSFALVATSGCSKPASADNGPEAVASAAPAEKAAAPAAKKAPAPAEAAAAADDKVEVPKEGKKFEPPVKPEQIPGGAWYCDMGTVHYARGEEGDGKCPLCHMKLKKKAAAPAK